MTNQVMWEIIGYIGSALVLVSLLMSSIVKLRIINAIGCAIFCCYAFAIHSIPTAIMNFALIIIDLVFLIKILSSKANFSFVKVDANDALVKHLCDKFSDDITMYFDSADISSADNVIVVFDDETVAGIFAGVSDGDRIKLLIDYTTIEYRDCKVAEFLYKKLASEYKELVYAGNNEKHISFCKKMGYSELDGEYVLKL